MDMVAEGFKGEMLRLLERTNISRSAASVNVECTSID
jgi:hypothetical protein